MKAEDFDELGQNHLRILRLLKERGVLIAYDPDTGSLEILIRNDDGRAQKATTIELAINNFGEKMEVANGY